MWFFHPQQTALWTHCDPTSPDHGEATQVNIMIRLAFKKDPHLWLCGGQMGRERRESGSEPGGCWSKKGVKAGKNGLTLQGGN